MVFKNTLQHKVYNVFYDLNSLDSHDTPFNHGKNTNNSGESNISGESKNSGESNNNNKSAQQVGISILYTIPLQPIISKSRMVINAFASR